nr:retrovirus-related Pol polyprotein from transposon TNT 1-94 [Tanacetum cinerariifolium]
KRPQFENINKNGPFILMSTGQRKPEGQWTADERKAANLDHRLKSLIMSVLLDDQINSDFQDSPNDEEDTKSSHEYLNDLEEEYQERALLAKSKRILLAESQRNTIDPLVAVTDSSMTDYDLANESSLCSTHLSPLKKLDGVEPISGPKTIKSILRSKSTFKAETLKGVIINGPSSAPARGNKSYSASKTQLLAPVGKLKSVKIKDDPPLAIYDIRKPIWYMDSGCLRHMTGVKSYLYKYAEQPGPKVVFGGDTTCTTEGYGSIKCKGIVFTKVAFVNGLKLSHLNFKTINKLPKQNLVIGLPSLVYSKDNPCSSCEKGKHHRASFRTKQTSSIKKCLHLLHMDLFGPVTSTSINHEKYTLVIVMSTQGRLGKFDEKANDGYLLGCSLVSKAFRVFNTRRQQTKETYHITFDESPDAIKFSKPLVDDINIAEIKRYPPDECLHPYEPSQRYVTPHSLAVIRPWFATIRYNGEIRVKGTLKKSFLPPSFFYFHSESASGCDALAEFTTKANPRKSAPNDSIPLQQGTNEESRSGEISKKIKVEDLLDLMQDTILDFLTHDSPQDEPIIILNESEEEETERYKDTHITSHDGPEDTLIPHHPYPKSIQIQQLMAQ